MCLLILKELYGENLAKCADFFYLIIFQLLVSRGTWFVDRAEVNQ